MSKEIILITGTRKGIGQYLAQYYAAQGHQVIGCSRTSPDWTLENYEHFDVDITHEKSVKQFFQQIKEKYEHITVLINNAGIAAMNHAILTPFSTVNNILATNIGGTFLFCREAARLMNKKNYGRIINFASIASPLKLEGEAIYAASKSAVITLTEILAKEFSSMNITVNAIGPTPIDTDLIRGISSQKIDDLLKKQAIARKGELDDVTNVTDFFISKRSNFITGQTLFLGGVA